MPSIKKKNLLRFSCFFSVPDYRNKMAALPPRRNSTPTKPSKQRPSPCQTLIQMGFSENRAEKALAATGLRGVQLASDWLFAHVNDSTLDVESPREYVLYLCPTGPLCDQIRTLWDETLFKCGWNAAHNLLPHITLCPFFKCSDSNAEALSIALKDLCTLYQEKLLFPSKIRLEKYISPNYIGLFLEDGQADVLKKFSEQFTNKIKPIASASTEASRKELHLTLAYSFQSYEFSVLESLAQNLDISSPVSWELRLYSRDTRINGNEVYKVLFSHVPREPDELELLRGDFVYVNGDSIAASMDGWVEGISWLTGSTGFLPRNYIKRTSESDAWTLLRSFPIVGCQKPNVEDDECVLLPRRPRISLSLLNLLENSEGSRRSTDVFSDASSVDRFHSKQSSFDSGQAAAVAQSTLELEALYAKVDKSRQHKKPLYKFPVEGPRKLIVVRHGERVDFTFAEWLRFSFDENGKYKRCNQNMPVSLPKRANAPVSFFTDCPLTNVGLLQARLIGDGFSISKTVVHHVYCSPSLRCVQTCTNILKGLGIAESMPINIEPGLFEWLAWYANGVPTWMSNEELIEAGFNIETEYKPLMPAADVLKLSETCEQFYDRNAYITQSLLSATQKDGGTVLFVGHASTVDTCTRQLVGGAPRNAHNMTTLIRKVPYCSVSTAIQNPNGSWSLCEPSSYPVTHSGNSHYDWKCLL